MRDFGCVRQREPVTSPRGSTTNAVEASGPGSVFFRFYIALGQTN